MYCMYLYEKYIYIQCVTITWANLLDSASDSSAAPTANFGGGGLNGTWGDHGKMGSTVNESTIINHIEELIIEDII